MLRAPSSLALDTSRVCVCHCLDCCGSSEKSGYSSVDQQYFKYQCFHLFKYCWNGVRQIWNRTRCTAECFTLIIGCCIIQNNFCVLIPIFDICLIYQFFKKLIHHFCEMKIILYSHSVFCMNFHIFLNADNLVMRSWFGGFAGRPRSSVPEFVVLRPRNSRRQVVTETENAHIFPEV